MNLRPVRLSVFGFACTLLLAASLPAQCVPQWTPGDPLPTPSGSVRGSTFWDPDGTGPLPSQLVVCGDLITDTPQSRGVLTYDGTAWTSVGTLASADGIAAWNGQLVAIYSSSQFTAHAARWDGSAWQQIGTFGNGAGTTFVTSLAVFNGELVVGGAFTTVSGVPAQSIARFDGTTWSPLGAGLGGIAYAMAVWNGQLRVGGSFLTAGGQPAGNLASWTGSTWIVGPSFNGAIRTIAVRTTVALATSYLFVGGDFTQYTIAAQNVAAARIARLEGLNNTWSPVGTGVPGTSCRALFVRNVGLTGYELAAGVLDTTSSARLWRFSAGAWAALGSFEPAATGPYPTTINYYGGRYTVGLATNTPDAMRSWDGTTWQPLRGRGLTGTVYAIEASGADVVIGGDFPTISGVTMNGIARGQANAWTPLGSGMTGGLGVFALATAANGDVVAAGDFLTAGGVACNRIARWDGSTWGPLGTGLAGTVLALLALPDGSVVAAGDFLTAGGVPCNRIARWNGSTWAPFGAGFPARVNAMARLPDGSLVAGGNFLSSGATVVNRIARWNGSAWQPLGTGCNDVVFALAVAPDGSLYAGGRFTTAGGLTTRIGRWQNGAWSSVISLGLNSAAVQAIGAHPSGDLFVGGETFSFSLGPFGGWSSNLVRIGAGGGSLSPENLVGTSVYDTAFPAGDLAVGGAFSRADSVVAANVARLHTPCPATGTAYGAGCAGLTAPLGLQVVDAPWLDSSYRLRATTFGPGSFGVQVLGLGQLALPLPAVLPGALPGCTGYVTPDDLTVGFPVAGELTFGGPVPNAPALVGFTLNAQVLQFEAVGSGLAISASNGVQLVLGTL